MNKFPIFYPMNFPKWKEKLSYWAEEKFQFIALTQGNDHDYPQGPFDNLFFAGNTELSEDELWQSQLFKVGIFGYDFKNQIEQLTSQNLEYFPLPELCFFEPEMALQLTTDGFYTSTEFSEAHLYEIANQAIPEQALFLCQVNPEITREEYLDRVHRIQNEILEGNTYEINFCQSFSGSFDSWNPVAAFFRLNELSKMPFAALFKAKNQWLISASPERFLKKIGSKLIAQPIKGTSRRGIQAEEDSKNRDKLISSEKERAENLMITDLMRNDLARVSQTGSVKVEELFGIYPFPRVWQMISTVSSAVRPGVSLKEIIHATFPMGSMTGAPKISTMKIIEREECFKRGWFSGAFGWIDTSGNFDFSVVIRSIIADLEAKKLYFGVGSAITIDASAELEYEECTLKAQALFELLRGT